MEYNYNNNNQRNMLCLINLQRKHLHMERNLLNPLPLKPNSHSQMSRLPIQGLKLGPTSEPLKSPKFRDLKGP